MELYNKEFVYFDWDDSLKGKQVMVSDDIYKLKRYVNGEEINICEVSKSSDNSYPFCVSGTAFRFCYYDPYYEFRKAYLEGKQIQFKDSTGNWRDVEGEPIFTRDEYRIKPESEYVPFDNLNEFISKWESMNPGCIVRPKCTMPMIWVKDKIGGCIYLINGYEPDDNRPVMIDNAWYSLEGLFRNYTFIDSSIIGKVKE